MRRILALILLLPLFCFSQNIGKLDGIDIIPGLVSFAITDFDSMGTNDDSVQVSINALGTGVTTIYHYINDSRMATPADTTGYIDSVYHAVADSDDVKTLAHGFTNVVDGDWIYLLTIVNRGLTSEYYEDDSCQIYDTTVPSGATFNLVTTYDTDSVEVSDFGSDVTSFTIAFKSTGGSYIQAVSASAADSNTYDDYAWSRYSLLRSWDANNDSTIGRVVITDDGGNTATTYDTTVAANYWTVDFLPDTGRHVLQAQKVYISDDNILSTVDDSVYMASADFDTTLGGDSVRVYVSRDGYTYTIPDSVTLAVSGDGDGKDTLTINLSGFPANDPPDSIRAFVKLGSVATDSSDNDTSLVAAGADSANFNPWGISWDIAQDTTAYVYGTYSDYAYFWGRPYIASTWGSVGDSFALSTSNWITTVASMNRDFVTMDSTGEVGGESEADLIAQNFEGTGYDNGESWIETTTNGTVNEDYTTTALRGSQSLFITKTGGDGGYVTSPSYSAPATAYGFFRFRFPVAPVSTTASFFRAYDESNNILVNLQINSDLAIRVFCGSTNLGFGSQLSAATNYYCWWTYTEGTDSDAQFSVWIGTTTTKPGTSYLSTTSADATTGNTYIRFYSGDTGTDGVIIDQVLIDESEIGNVQN